MPSPAYQISSLGNYMVSSGANGNAQIFKLCPQQLTVKGQGVEQIHEFQLNNKLLQDFPISPPKQMVRSARVKYAAFEPCAVNHADVNLRRVGAIQTSNFYLYDIPSGRIIGSENFGRQYLTKFHYSRHAPFGSLLALASYDSSISVLDTRLLQEGSKSSVWHIPDAHNGHVTDVAFNNFIPFWLASSGDDGVVKMWDIRFLKSPAARIDAHYSSISAVF
jgi:WD40 repeat protein